MKPHPGNWRSPEVLECVQECAGNLKNVFVSTGNIHHLIAASRGVITINSGVGFESLVHGRPVATLGNCDYKGATHRSGNLDEAARYIENYSEDQRLAACRFVYYYCFFHSYFVTPERVPDLRVRMLRQLTNALRPAAARPSTA